MVLTYGMSCLLSFVSYICPRCNPYLYLHLYHPPLVRSFVRSSTPPCTPLPYISSTHLTILLFFFFDFPSPAILPPASTTHFSLLSLTRQRANLPVIHLCIRAPRSSLQQSAVDRPELHCWCFHCIQMRSRQPELP